MLLLLVLLFVNRIPPPIDVAYPFSQTITLSKGHDVPPPTTSTRFLRVSSLYALWGEEEESSYCMFVLVTNTPTSILFDELVSCSAISNLIELNFCVLSPRPVVLSIIPFFQYRPPPRV